MAKAKRKALGNDPLFSTPADESFEESFDDSQDGEEKDLSEIVSTEKLEAVKQTLKEMKHEVVKLEQRKRNHESEYQRMTFIVRKDLLSKLRDYCYTERLSQKEGLEEALVSFLDGKTDLFEAPERPKQTHKRG